MNKVMKCTNCRNDASNIDGLCFFCHEEAVTGHKIDRRDAGAILLEELDERSATTN